jgi:hypothetical protein
MKTAIALLLHGLIFFSFREMPERTAGTPVRIQWVDKPGGDFSFRYKWDYPESVYKNQFGQLSCDGDCPPEIGTMKNNEGRIYKDSLRAFYNLVDTTHQFHSIQCVAWCYEWAGTDYIDVTPSGDSIHCATVCNMATHCSLHLDFAKDSCYAFIKLRSIVAGGDAVYPCTGGYLKIDKYLWAKGIMKAEFSLNFEHRENPQKPIYWRGRIYKRIKDGPI